MAIKIKCSTFFKSDAGKMEANCEVVLLDWPLDVDYYGMVTSQNSLNSWLLIQVQGNHLLRWLRRFNQRQDGRIKYTYKNILLLAIHKSKRAAFVQLNPY